MAGAPKACRIPHRYVYICFITLYSLFLIPTLPYVIVFCILYFAVATLVTRLFRMDHNAPGRNSNQDAILEQGYEVQPPRSTRRENDNLAQTLGLWTALHSRTHFYDTHAISVPYDLADEYHPELEFLAHPSSPYHPASTLDISPSSGATNNTDGSLLDGTFALNRAPYSPASIEVRLGGFCFHPLHEPQSLKWPSTSVVDLGAIPFLVHSFVVFSAVFVLLISI